MYHPSTRSRAQGVFRRNVRLDFTLGSWRKQRIGTRRPISAHPYRSTSSLTIASSVIPCNGSRGWEVDGGWVMGDALQGARLHFGGEFYKRFWEMEDSFRGEVGSGYGATLIRQRSSDRSMLECQGLEELIDENGTGSGRASPRCARQNKLGLLPCLLPATLYPVHRTAEMRGT